VWSLLKLRHFLDGHRFLTRTGNEALSWIYSTTDYSGTLKARYVGGQPGVGRQEREQQAGYQQAGSDHAGGEQMGQGHRRREQERGGHGRDRGSAKAREKVTQKKQRRRAERRYGDRQRPTMFRELVQFAKGKWAKGQWAKAQWETRQRARRRWIPRLHASRRRA